MVSKYPVNLQLMRFHNNEKVMYQHRRKINNSSVWDCIQASFLYLYDAYRYHGYDRMLYGPASYAQRREQ